MKTSKNNFVKNVYLHVGLHKTATSSIQHTMWKNKEILRDLGIYYPFTWKHNHGVIIESMFSSNELLLKNTKNIYYVKVGLNSVDKIKSYTLSNQNKINTELSELECSTVVFSGEAMIEMPSESLSSLKHTLHEWFPEATIYVIIYVRERSAYASSFYQQEIKAGKNATIEMFENLYFDSINKFSDVFSKETIKIIKFEETLSNGRGPVECFLETIGMNEKDIKKIDVKRANLGISDKSLEIIAFINERLSMTDGNQFRRGRVNRDTHHLHKIRGDKYRLDPTVVNSIVELGKKDTAWLNEEYGIDYLNMDLSTKDTGSHFQYGQDYYVDVVNCYDGLTTVLKKLVYEFFLLKSSEDLDSDSSFVINSIIKWIEHQYTDVVEKTVAQLIKEQERKLRQKKIKNQFKSILKRVLLIK